MVASNGMTLYTFDNDKAGSGKSVCNGPCAGLWPPLMVSSTDQPAGDYSMVTRDDGSRQLAYKGDFDRAGSTPLVGQGARTPGRTGTDGMFW